MAKWDKVPIGQIYCLQPSIGLFELTMQEAAVFFGATQKEILRMTKRCPLQAYAAPIGRDIHYFLDDGTHRAYAIRFHSSDPSPEINVYVNTRFDYPENYSAIFYKRRQQDFTVDNLSIRP